MENERCNILTYRIKGSESNVIIGLKGKPQIEFHDDTFFRIVQDSFNGVGKSIPELCSIANENSVLFIVYNDRVITFGSASVEFIGSNGFRVFYNDGIVFEKSSRQGRKLPNGYGWLVLLFIAVIAICFSVVKNCERGKDAPRDTVPIVPSLTPITPKSIINNEETITLSYKPITIVPSVPEVEEVMEVVDEIEEEKTTMVNNLEQTSPLSLETNITEPSNTSKNIDTLFENYKNDGLNHYQLYFERGYEEDKEAAIRCFKEAQKIKKDNQIETYLKTLESKY